MVAPPSTALAPGRGRLKPLASGRGERPCGCSHPFAVFGVLRLLHEILWYLSEAVDRLPDGALEKGEPAGCAGGWNTPPAAPPENLVDLDVATHQSDAGVLFERVSHALRQDPQIGVAWRGSDLAGRRLQGADLRRADLRGACLIRADLLAPTFVRPTCSALTFEGRIYVGEPRRRHLPDPGPSPRGRRRPKDGVAVRPQAATALVMTHVAGPPDRSGPTCTRPGLALVTCETVT